MVLGDQVGNRGSRNRESNTEVRMLMEEVQLSGLNHRKAPKSCVRHQQGVWYIQFGKHVLDFYMSKIEKPTLLFASFLFLDYSGMSSELYLHVCTMTTMHGCVCTPIIRGELRT